MEVEYAPTEADIAAEDDQANAKKFGPVEYANDPTQASLNEDVLAPLIPPIALGLLAFGLVGLVIWTGQRMTNSGLSHGIGYTRALDREMATPGPDPVYHPYYRGASPKRGYVQSAPPPPVNAALVNGPFLGQEQREAAHAALRPIRALLSMVRSVDAKGLWEDPSAVQSAGQASTIPTIQLPVNGVAPAPFPGRPGGNSGLNGNAAAVSRAATFQGSGIVNPAANPDALRQVELIHERTEALSSEVDRTTPPMEYPDALQPGVKGVSEELHGYLKDADLAATADAQNRALLRSQAARRLQQAQAYADYMESIINGTTDASHIPRPLVGTSGTNGR